MPTDAGQVQRRAGNQRGGGGGRLHRRLDHRLGLRVGGRGGLCRGLLDRFGSRIVTTHLGGERLDLGGGPLGGLEPIGLLLPDVLNAGGKGTHPRHALVVDRVLCGKLSERGTSLVESLGKLVVVEGADVLGKLKLGHGTDLQ